MRRRLSQRLRVAGGAGVLLVAGVLAAMAGGVGGGAGVGPGRGAGGAGSSAAAAATGAGAPSVSLTLAGGGGRPIPSGFLGFSFEFQAVRAYTGADPGAVDPVLVSLIRNLTPGQAPVLRIGGDSTDVSYAPAPGVRPPSWVAYRLTPSWMARTAALAHELGARMIMGLNLAADMPALAAAEARAYDRALGPSAIEALEIGNEPNIYQKVNVARTVFGLPVTARPSGFGYHAWRRQFEATALAAPGPALAGPALAIGPTPSPGSWVQFMPSFLATQPRLPIMTVHRYPLRNCNVGRRDPQYPTIAHLLAPYATAGLAHSLTRWVRIAHTAGRLIRVDELNSVACRGKTGVSDTFASALWVTDALFSLAHAGVDGIDMHTLPGAAYELFQFSRDGGGRWQANVRPVYYGLQLFAQAAPAGARLIAVRRTGAGGALSTWATRARDGSVRVVLINKSRSAGATASIAVPAGPGAAAQATVERMIAPSAAAKSGVTLGSRTYGAQTTTGRLAAPVVSRVPVGGGRVMVSVPLASAALVTFPAATP